MGELVATAGVSTIGVHHVCQRAGISRRTFYELYRDRDACFADALQEAYCRLVAHVEQAVAGAGDGWEDRAVATVQALVGALHADRALAQLCVVSATGGNREAVRLRHAAMAQILKGLADPPASAAAGEPVLAGALGGVWELVYRRLTAEPETPVAELADAAVYVLLAPFIGPHRAAARARDLDAAVVVGLPRALGAPAELGDGSMMTELAGQTLQYLSEHPGSANVEIARAVDVRHESQMSRHLVRLERAGLVERRKEGRTNAWRLTARGEEAERALYGAPAHQNFDSAGTSRRDEAASPRPHTRTVSMADPGDSPKSNRKRIP
jgi:AcrR family transcriptional regulator/predicted transcriptional regulator